MNRWIVAVALTCLLGSSAMAQDQREQARASFMKAVAACKAAMSAVPRKYVGIVDRTGKWSVSAIELAEVVEADAVESGSLVAPWKGWVTLRIFRWNGKVHYSTEAAASAVNPIGDSGFKLDSTYKIRLSWSPEAGWSVQGTDASDLVKGYPPEKRTIRRQEMRSDLADRSPGHACAYAIDAKLR